MRYAIEEFDNHVDHGWGFIVRDAGGFPVIRVSNTEPKDDQRRESVRQVVLKELAELEKKAP